MTRWNTCFTCFSQHVKCGNLALLFMEQSIAFQLHVAETLGQNNMWYFVQFINIWFESDTWSMGESDRWSLQWRMMDSLHVPVNYWTRYTQHRHQSYCDFPCLLAFFQLPDLCVQIQIVFIKINSDSEETPTTLYLSLAIDHLPGLLWSNTGKLTFP